MEIESKGSTRLIAGILVGVIPLGISFALSRPKSEERKPASTQANEPSCNYSYFDRTNLLTMSRGASVKTIADVLRSAPDCFKQNQVAIYDSGSLQCATYKAPRVLLYLNDEVHGNTVCAFNSGINADYAQFYQKNPNANCHENTLECESFNPDTNRFEFYEVSDGTKSGARGLTVSEVNPNQCMTCHRGTPFLGAADPRPNLENYPAWPGFYGSMHDKFGATPTEKEHYFADYLKYKTQNPRYSTLPDVVSTDGHYPSGNSKPAVNLQNLLEGQDQERIAAEFTSPDTLKRIWPFRYAILGALACDDDMEFRDDHEKLLPAERRFEVESFLPTRLRSAASIPFAKTASMALEEHQKNLRKLMSLQEEQGKVTFEQFVHQYSMDLSNDPAKPYLSYLVEDQDDFWNAVRLAYIAENLGLPTRDWSMTFGDTLDFEAGDQNIKQVLPLIAPWLLDRAQDGDLKLSLDTHLGIPPDPIQCELLRNKSLTALAKISSWPNSEEGEGPVHSGPPQRLSSCIGCHVDGEAPAIPFTDPALLKQAFDREATTDPRKTLYQEIFYRLDSGSMPPNAPLDPTDKRALEDYFRTISESPKSK